MNRVDLDLLLSELDRRLAGESDQPALDLRHQVISARASIARQCPAAVALQALVDAANVGHNMGRTDDPSVMRLWADADRALKAPCTPIRPRAADCVYHHAVLQRSDHWINGPRSFQPEAADVIEVWRGRARDTAQPIATLAERVLDAVYALVDIRQGFPTDKERQAQGHPPAEKYISYLVLATQQLEELDEKLRAVGL